MKYKMGFQQDFKYEAKRTLDECIGMNELFKLMKTTNDAFNLINKSRKKMQPRN